MPCRKGVVNDADGAPSEVYTVLADADAPPAEVSEVCDQEASACSTSR